MVTIRQLPIVIYFSVLGIVVCLGTALIGGIAYWFEDATVGLGLMIPALGIGLYGLLALALAPQSVTFHADRLIIRRWTRTQTLPYGAIAALSQTHRAITLTTQTQTLRLHKLFAATDTQLYQAFETYVPIAQRARARRLASPLPIVFQARRVAAWANGFGGLMTVAGGVVVGASPWLPGVELTLSEGIMMALFGLVSIAIGGLLLYLVLWTYPHRTVFTADHITQHFLTRTVVQPLEPVVDIQLGYASRTLRDVSRRLYQITFVCGNGDRLPWIPNEFDFPIDYVDAVAAVVATDL
ncbi:MAG: hypothetical protein O3A14_07845 [Cyanobacteria bacterium]|nr:hypothetical protein [Cyanobacteriota bacterium]